MMTLAEIKSMRGEGLYDCDGNMVGKWNGERGMFCDCFVVREHVCLFVPMQGGGYECNRCRTRFKTMKARPHYCPHCGARVVNDDD